MKKKQIITIAGQPGSGKSTTAKEVASRLGFQHFSSGDLYRKLAKKRGVDILRAVRSSEQSAVLDNLVDGRLQSIGAKEDRKVIDSRTAWHWIPSSFKVFLELDLKIAAQRILSEGIETRLKSEKVHNNPSEYARGLKHRLDSETKRYKAKYGIDPYDMNNYDLVIDTSANNAEKVVDLVVEGFQDWLNEK